MDNRSKISDKESVNPELNPESEGIINEDSIELIINEVVKDPIMDPIILGLLITSIFVSVLVCFYSKTLNRRPLIWFMMSFSSSLPTFFIPIGPMIFFAILVYKGRLPSKEELEELNIFIQDFISLYEDKKHLAEKDVVMRTLYLRVKKDKNKTNKWEITNALNSLVSL